jgi:hypothetical protein
LGIIDFTIQGDVGGNGLSRVHFQRSDFGTIVSADANAAAAAWHGLWQAAHTEVPSAVIISPSSECKRIDPTTGAPIGVANLTSVPGAVFGSSTAHYAAGTGARIQWHTSQIHNRRLIRGATFLVPLTADAFTASGVLNATIQANYVTASAAVLAAMTAASLTLVVWHRPPKGSFTGGIGAVVTASSVLGEAAQLKSRRS